MRSLWREHVDLGVELPQGENRAVTSLLRLIRYPAEGGVFSSAGGTF